jgi:hypothetical protein
MVYTICALTCPEDIAWGVRRERRSQRGEAGLGDEEMIGWKDVRT